MTARIVISEFMDEGSVRRLAAAAETLYDPKLVDDPAKLIEVAAGAEALIVRNRTRVDEALISRLPVLKVVGRLGVGLDNIDLEAASRRGIAVIPATGANAAAVAEYVIAALLVLIRPVWSSTRDVTSGAWPRESLIRGEIGGRTLGLLGYGGIAREVARRARAFDMTVIAHDPMIPSTDAAWAELGVEPVSFDRLVAESDALSLHVPLTEDTRGLVGRNLFARMKPRAVLVNTARGGIVDEAALAEALKAGRLSGAAIDVFETEPLPAGSPLSGAPNLIATPHIAGVTDESNLRVGTLIASRVLQALGISS